MIEGLKTGITRRKMIGFVGLISLLPLAGLWYSMVNRQIRRKEPEMIRIPLDQLPEGISYYDLFIISKNENEIIVYSTSCSHLGCRLKTDGEGKLICPCHGSEFTLTDGKPIKGPAIESLEKYDFSLTDSYIEITLS